MLKRLPILVFVVAIAALSVVAQDLQVRNLVAGQKYEIKGVVIVTDDTGYIVRDSVGVDTRVRVSPETTVKSNSFWGSGNSYPTASIVRGLALKTEGRGGSDGALMATKIRFDKSDLEVAQSINSRVEPVEGRLTQAEQNAERISGQIDELLAISNAARGGAKAAQQTADAAVAGVNATNQRISALDDYVVQSTEMVNFRVGSSSLDQEAMRRLDEVAVTAITMRGYTLEITGFASADGSASANKALSKRRAQAVIDYLVETHNIPLRRIGTSYGFGEKQAIADNSTRQGRAENRRVEVKVLVSRGLNQNVEVRATEDDDEDNR